MKCSRKPLSILLSILVLTSFTATVFSSTDYFTYDSNGNLIRDGSFCYDYNDAHRLKAVTDCAGNTLAQYWYDHTGRKIKAIEGEATIYYWANGEFVEVIGGPYHGNYTYYFANGERVAWKGPDGKMHYIHGDHLGSTVMVTDVNGNVEEETTYYPYGGIRSGGNETRYLYTGQEYLRELGLYDYGARQYNPGLMHFIQADPVIADVYDPQSLNRYSYVRNNPVKYVDPTGNQAESVVVTPGVAYLAYYIPPVALIVGGTIVFVYCMTEAYEQANSLYSYLTETPHVNPGERNQNINVESEEYSNQNSQNPSAGNDGDSDEKDDKIKAIEESGKRFFDNGPQGSKNFKTEKMPDGSTKYSYEVPGRVPGSKKIYEKTVNSEGETIDFRKTTYDPEGKVVHVKDAYGNIIQI